MKNLKWIAIIIALLLTTQGKSYALDPQKNDVKQNRITKCIESLKKSEKLGEYKQRTTKYWSDVYKSKGLRFFVTDSQYVIDRLSLYSYAPLKSNYTLMGRFSNLFTFLNPFRWIGIVLKGHDYKFAPITPVLNYHISKKAGKSKKLSRFSSMLVNASVIIVAHTAMASKQARTAREIHQAQMEYVIENKEYFDEKLMRDYRYASIDKHSQDQINSTISELYDNLQTTKQDADSVEEIPTLKFREHVESQHEVHDAIMNNALLQVYWLEQEYKKYHKHGGTENLLALDVEENVSRFCDSPMFHKACIIAEDIPKEHEQIAKEAFDLTHMLYESYDLVDFVTRPELLSYNAALDYIKDHGYENNLLVQNSAENFLHDMLKFGSEGILPTHQLDWFLKRDMHLQFNIKMETFAKILDGILTYDELQSVHNAIDEKVNTIRAATKLDIQQSR